MTSGRRLLVVTLDAAGNWPPELALIRALRERGHEVRVLTGEVHGAQLAEVGTVYRPYRCVAQRAPSARRDDLPEEEMARVLESLA